MLVYGMLFLILIAAYAISSLRESRRLHLALMIFCLISMALVAGIRATNIGTDGRAYFDIFHAYESDFGAKCNVERGYCAFNKVLASLGFTFPWVFLLESCFLYFCIGYFIYTIIDNEFWCFAVFLVYVTQLFFTALNLSRQYIAISLALLAFTLLAKRLYISSTIFLLLGTTIHKSTWIIVLLPFVYYLTRFKKPFAVGAIIAYFVSFVVRIKGVQPIFVPFISAMPRYSHYLNNNPDFEANASLRYSLVVNLIPNALFLFSVLILLWSEGKRLTHGRWENRLAKQVTTERRDVFAPVSKFSLDRIFHRISGDSSCDQSQPQGLNLTRYAIAGALIYVLAINSLSAVRILIRLADYFIFFLIALSTYAFSRIKGRTRTILQILLLVGYSVLCFYLIIVKGHNEVIPFHVNTGRWSPRWWPL